MTEDVDGDLRRLQERGFLIFERLLSEEYLGELREALRPHLEPRIPGRNDFEGTKTQRVYALLGKSLAFNHLTLHSRIVAMLDRLLLPSYLLTAHQAIQINPGETPQRFHFDDEFTFLPRPRPPLSYSTIWAIDEFTDDNGATVVIPGSHLWGDELPDDSAETCTIVMPPGSVVFFPSTLWHGGGANTGTRTRLAISAQYCEPWVRPQENQFLAVSPELARRHPEAIRTLLGYSIHPPFIGHVNGMHPARCIGTYED